ncbi:LuxR C-terminal-related transcriptional regulator, partial [Streptomyces phytophilus]|uniref:LuxR C-terminal-related transcriptional regulator n=1 Tax=Streptomyces phytophilus TaxID=722715 RepID=UPI00215D823E
MPLRSSYDAVVVGGGHNGLVAAAYLAHAGRSVLLLERLDHTGGAAVSARTFAGVDARLSRYSYLVSLLPRAIVDDLGLAFAVRKRAVSSYTPAVRGGRPTGLLVETDPGSATRESFAALTGGDREFDAWQRFYGMTQHVAERVFPTLTEPLPTRGELRARIGDDAAWRALFERPLGETVEETFADDLVRGVVLTDGLIGTFASAHDPSLAQNRCFLYHVIGGGTGEEALAAAAKLKPDIVLMDLQLGPGMDGVTATRRIVAELPGTRVLVLTTYDTDADITRAVGAGATGYLLKAERPEELFSAIHAAAEGRTALSPPVADRVMAQLRTPRPALTDRERDILAQLARGSSNREIARALFISEATVKTHLGRIYDKLGVDSRAAAVAVANEQRL